MELVIYTLIIVAVLILVGYIVLGGQRRPKTHPPIPAPYREILAEHIEFYKKLDEAKKQEFETRIQAFLSKVRITGVKTGVEDIDRVFVASSAIIPSFGFPGWDYINLNEVLLYPDSFGDEFEQEGQHRSTVGIVGSGALSNVMILSRHELRRAFINKTGRSNVAIHEFVHLVDKTDGSVDGIPEFFLERKYVLPWLELMQKNIRKIIDDRSDINAYGATNEAEFFAVVAEYFFERPELLKTKHPELYELLVKIFRQHPDNPGA